MNTTTTGVLVRAYAKESEKMPEVVARAVENAKILSKIFVGVAIVVPRDYDCGSTAEKIREGLALLELQNIIVVEPHGHHSREALNEGILELVLRFDVIDRVAIISGKAVGNISPAVMTGVNEAFENGARVVGLAIEKLAPIVLEGRVQNTFAVWDIPSFVEVGGFASKEGVEEIEPLVELVRQFGKCIAVLQPKDGGKLVIRDGGHDRHKEVINYKIERQQSAVSCLGVDFTFIQSGILPGYPKKI